MDIRFINRAFAKHTFGFPNMTTIAPIPMTLSNISLKPNSISYNISSTEILIKFYLRLSYTHSVCSKAKFLTLNTDLTLNNTGYSKANLGRQKVESTHLQFIFSYNKDLFISFKENTQCRALLI